MVVVVVVFITDCKIPVPVMITETQGANCCCELTGNRDRCRGGCCGCVYHRL